MVLPRAAVPRQTLQGSRRRSRQRAALRILLVTSPGFTSADVEEIRAAVPGATYLTATDDTVWEHVVGVDALIGCPRRGLSPDLLRRAGRRLQWVHASGAGIEDVVIPPVMAGKLVLTNGKMIQGPEVADHAMAFLLALTRNLHLVLSGRTEGSMPRPVELRGKVALIVGVGGVGLLVAERAAAFGMRVVGVNDEMVPLLHLLERVYLPEQLEEALPAADAVLICAPLTKRTERWFARQHFQLMKPAAYFINVARGRIVSTEALVEALEGGRLRGVGLDVTDPEPLPDDHPLRRFPHVILTPHIAGLSEHNRRRSVELITMNVRRFVQGLPLLNVVDNERGY